MNTRAVRWVFGSSFVVAPVAMMQSSKVTVSSPASVVTERVLASTKVPHPFSWVILFFRIRKWTPFTIRSETLRLRLKAAW